MVNRFDNITNSTGEPMSLKIITAHDTVTINGIAVAVEGCVTECDCKLIGSLPATVG